LEKITFNLDDTKGTAEFFVLEQTKMAGVNYILVTDSAEAAAECLILKDTSGAEEAESIYEVVEEEAELLAVSRLFEELLEDIEIEM